MRLILLLLVACSSTRTYSLEELPASEWTGGLPVTGDGKLRVNIVPSKPTDWTKVKGTVTFTCIDCTLGDGKTKLRVPWGDETIDVEFGRLRLGRVDAKLEFADGKLAMTTQWRSDDLILDASIDATLAKEASDIALDGCIVFRPTDTLLARDARSHAMVSTTGAPLDESGRYTIKIEGKLGGMKRLGKTCTVNE